MEELAIRDRRDDLADFDRVIDALAIAFRNFRGSFDEIGSVWRKEFPVGQVDELLCEILQGTLLCL